jgi:hypothetical protein
MGERIWGVLAQYAGRWVALDDQGRVTDDAPTLSDLLGRFAGGLRRPTILYAATQPPVRS